MNLIEQGIFKGEGGVGVERDVKSAVEGGCVAGPFKQEPASDSPN